MSGVAILGLAALSAWLAVNIAGCGRGGDLEQALASNVWPLTNHVNNSEAIDGATLIQRVGCCLTPGGGPILDRDNVTPRVTLSPPFIRMSSDGR
jgi:hypothetical protein